MSLLLFLKPVKDALPVGGYIPQYEGRHPWQKVEERKEHRSKQAKKLVEKVEKEATSEVVEQKSEELRGEFQEGETNFEPLYMMILDLESQLEDLLHEQERERAELVALQMLAAERILRQRYEDEVLFTLLFMD